MYTLKGFVTINELIDNAVGVVSPVGELSQLSQTFSREIGYYPNSAGTLRLVSLFSQDENGLAPVPSTYSSKTLEILTWIHDQAQIGLFDDTLQDFLDSLTAQFTGEIEEVEAGEMVQAGAAWYPSWIRFKQLGTSDDNNIRVWFSDEDLGNQYDEYHIIVVPPIEPIDALQSDYVSVGTALDNVTPIDRSNNIQAAIGDYPDTLSRALVYEWVDPNNPSNLIPTYWNVVIYGPAGNNQDIIKQTIADWILANSAKGLPDWEDLLPDIFKATEFIIAPFWNDYSIPNQTVKAGIYSPTIEVSDITAYLRWACSGWPVGHVDNAANIMATTYKSLAAVVAGGPDNRDGVIKFRTQFPDYAAIPTGNTDFNRISPTTQTFITLLSDLIVAAEEMTDVSDIPVGMDRLVRDGKTYCAASYDNILYLVLTKETGETYTP